MHCSPPCVIDDPDETSSIASHVRRPDEPLQQLVKRHNGGFVPTGKHLTVPLHGTPELVFEERNFSVPWQFVDRIVERLEGAGLCSSAPLSAEMRRANSVLR